MKANITLCNHNDDRIQVEIKYYLERERGYYAITYMKILSPILPGFVPSDVQTDLEESIAQIENVSDVRLKCRVEYCDSLQMQRLLSINPECKLMRVS